MFERERERGLTWSELLSIERHSLFARSRIRTHAHESRVWRKPPLDTHAALVRYRSGAGYSLARSIDR